MCKGLHPSLTFFGQQVHLCSTRSQPQYCRSLLNLLLLDATVFTAAFPSTSQGMHPLVALEKSTLRRMSLVQYSSCCRVSPKLSASPDFQMQSDSMRWRILSPKKRLIHRCWTRLGHNSIFFFLILYPRRHCGAAYQAEILGAASGAEIDDIKQMKKIFPLITCEISFSQKVCELVFGINVSNLNFTIKINPVKQLTTAALWVLDTCLVVGLRPFIIILITASLSSKTQHSTRTRMR